MELRQELQTTLVLATHSSEISSKADHIVRLADGRIHTSNDMDASKCFTSVLFSG